MKMWTGHSSTGYRRSFRKDSGGAAGPHTLWAGKQTAQGMWWTWTDQAQIDVHKLKDGWDCRGSVAAESQLIWLAWWMKERYGSTMNQALKTVLPVKQKVRRLPSGESVTLVDKGCLKNWRRKPGERSIRQGCWLFRGAASDKRYSV